MTNKKFKQRTIPTRTRRSMRIDYKGLAKALMVVANAAETLQAQINWFGLRDVLAEHI